MNLPSAEELLRSMEISDVYEVADRTRLTAARRLSGIAGRPVWLKREDEQPVHSFKLRGAYQLMSSLDRARLDRGVVAASAGNHAQGVAVSASRLGCRATIVVPRTAPTIKQEAIRSLGAELLVEGDNFDEAKEVALALAAAEDRPFIPPYDHPEVLVGQGTVGVEMHDQAPADLQAVFVPVGGGGLLAGVALALKQLRPGIKVFGVEAEDSAAMAESLRAGGIVSLDHVGQFADGCAVRRVGEVTFHLVRRWADGVIRVSTDEICAAVKEIYEDCRALVEPAGALGFAGLKKWAGEHPGDRPLATILSGANLNFDRLQFIAERAGVGERAEVILAIRIPERPGSFLGLIRALHGRSITEFNYRIGPSAEAAVFVGVSCQGEADVASLLARLKQEGFPVRNLTGDETAKSHIRHMVGGRSMEARNERIFRVEFPERPGALEAFLTDLDGRWNISLFHYRNHGSDRGRALVGFQVAGMDLGFERFIADLEDRAIEVGDSPAVDLFLRPTNIART